MTRGSTHPLEQKWVPGIFLVVKGGRCVRLTTSPPYMSRLFFLQMILRSTGIYVLYKKNIALSKRHQFGLLRITVMWLYASQPWNELKLLLRPQIGVARTDCPHLIRAVRLLIAAYLPIFQSRRHSLHMNAGSDNSACRRKFVFGGWTQ
jgi:hypothetical protein